MVGDVWDFPKAFSNSGSLFTHCASNGRLTIWDTATGVLKQEFTKSAHLNSTCSCLVWVQISKHNGHKRKKLKSSQNVAENLDLIALGTTVGNVTLYDVTTNSVVAELEEHSGKVNHLTWSSSLNSLFSCSDDKHIIEWDLNLHKIKSKWKIGKENVSCILALSNGKHLLSASYSIKLWDLEKKQIIKTFVGHGTEVTSLVEVPNKDGYFVSSGKGERVLSVWSLNSSEKKSNQIASLILQNSAQSVQMLHYEGERPTILFAITEEGILQIFKHKFNGNLCKPLKPIASLSLASGNNESKHSHPIAIQAVFPYPNDKILIVYGNLPFLTFEVVALNEIEQENIVLVRQYTKKVPVNEFNSKTKVPIGSNDVDYQIPGVSLKRGNKKAMDVPLEERLENLALVNSQSNEGPKKDNMAHLLLQGLQSKDKNILQSILLRTEQSVIDVTVKHLPVQALVPLIRELTVFMQGKTFTTKSAVEWLRSIVRTHSGVLLSNPELTEMFGPLLASIEAKVAVLAPLLKLKGRLALITEQMGFNLDEKSEDTVEPIYTYEEESSDEGDVEKMSEGSLSESEDSWDEYSDLGDGVDEK
ncbi:hypothetical protein RUM44_003313 [Polyplax serrata]|uniref:Small-subunit processome Utp12 domain-containing protein n=1 Tax=Polyplax serrata TaxID=468196 RepID=A0ABR1AG33_POLSC